MPINLIFAGTAEIGVPLLRQLAKDPRFTLSLVITQEDHPAGRKMELLPSPIKQAAQQLGLSIFQPKNINDPMSLEKILLLKPEVILVFAYGQLLKEPILVLPKKGCLNVHASLLPLYRGASPIQAALLSGDKQTGISLMQMKKGLDSGPVFEKFATEIDPNENAQTLHDKLARLSANTIPGALIRVIRSETQAAPQDDCKATHVSKIQKSDGQIDWNQDVGAIANKVRAFYGWPSSYTHFKGKLLKIHQARPHQASLSEAVGTVIEKDGKIGIVCQNGFLELITVQIEGKKPQSIRDFVNGNQDFIGNRLDY